MIKQLKNSSIFNLAGLVIAWFIIFGFFAWKGPPTFHSLDNLETMARQGTIVSIATLGMTCIIICGGIDLSVGSVVAFVGVVIAALLVSGKSPWIALLGGVAAGGVCGLFNGILITRVKVVPFIVTLGTMLIVRGGAKWVANDKSINPLPNWLDDIISRPPKVEGKPAGGFVGAVFSGVTHLFPVGVWLLLFLALMVSLMLKRTRFGRHIVAVGSNEQAARLCGVPVERVKVLVYMLGGMFFGLSGLMTFSRLTLADPTVAQGLELDVIAAVVIGGASLNGGQGSVLGSLLGAWIMTTISTGCSMMGWSTFVEQIVTGAIIIISVAIDRMRVRKD